MAEQGPQGPMVPVTPEAIVDAMLRAILVAANHSSVTEDARDMQASSDAALKFAQAVVLLDPSLDPQGVPLSHHTALEQMRGQNALEQVREKAAAPSPAKQGSNGASS